MAINPYFPVSYQPIGFNQPVIPPYSPQNQAITGDYGQSLTNTHPSQITPQNGIIWVQGESGAKAYPVAPNQTVQLWDSEGQVVYLKSADGSGMPSMKILDYTIRETPVAKPLQTAQQDMSAYVTKEEFEKRLAELVSHETEKKVTLNE